MSLAPSTLESRTALVTGAGQGIGLAVSYALLAAGANVVVIDRDSAGIAALAEANSTVTPVAGDVIDPALPEKLGAALDAAKLDLDIRVNAVAPGPITPPLTAERIRTEARRRHVMIDGAPLRQVDTPKDVVHAVHFPDTDAASFIPGQVLAVDGGWATGRFPQKGTV